VDKAEGTFMGHDLKDNNELAAVLAIATAELTLLDNALANLRQRRTDVCRFIALGATLYPEYHERCPPNLSVAGSEENDGVTLTTPVGSPSPVQTE
jgi:hypothetical protein